MSSEFRLRLRLRKLWLPMSILVVAGVLRYLSMAHYSQRTDACILFNDRCPLDQPVPTVRGYAAPGYEPLATALQQLVHKGYTLGASVAVYLEDKPVVSLTAGTGQKERERERVVTPCSSSVCLSLAPSLSFDLIIIPMPAQFCLFKHFSSSSSFRLLLCNGCVAALLRCPPMCHYLRALLTHIASQPWATSLA